MFLIKSVLQSDSTRSKDLELHIQSRVQAELARLEAEQDKAIKAIQETLSEDPSSADSSPQVGFDGRAKEDKLKDLGRESVLKEIEALRTRLNHRKTREEIVNDKAVEKAKSELVTCLRLNDRRPLDCWKEVESFKQEVGRLEKGFLGRILE
jgi:altered-inheritance-of-mitochondria protein 13